MKLYRQLTPIVTLVLAASLLPGCGSSGGSSLSVTQNDATRFTPNYVSDLDRLLAWPSLPVRVFFVRDNNYSTARQNVALAGFDQWVTATGGVISYTVVDSLANSDINVSFDPTTQDGLTRLHFTDYTMQSADMFLGVQNLPNADLQCVAAHEMGHALGIDGHSKQQGDLMYFQHVIGDVCPVTTRDLDTMKTAYISLFTRGRLAPARTPTGRAETVTIR